MVKVNITYLFANVNPKFLYHNKKYYFEMMFDCLTLKNSEEESEMGTALLIEVSVSM